jgi:hypothetical protein
LLAVGKTRVSKKELTPEERVIQTKKRKDQRAVMRVKKAHQAAEVATRLATEMALEIQANAKLGISPSMAEAMLMSKNNIVEI